MNLDPAPFIGLTEPPSILLWAWENKGYACMMAFFLGKLYCLSNKELSRYFLPGNAIENTLVSTGAFEIYLEDERLWSKLETGRIPSQGIVNQCQASLNIL